MALIGLIETNGLNGTSRFRLFKPLLNQETVDPSLCMVDSPVATTAESSLLM